LLGGKEQQGMHAEMFRFWLRAFVAMFFFIFFDEEMLSFDVVVLSVVFV
jgi:hypothetical protein